MTDDMASELLDDMPAVLGDLIGAVGRGVADAQHALDVAALDRLTAIATADGRVAETLRAIGYQPTWYRIPELNADLTVSLTLAGRTESSGRPGGLQLYATPIDANFSNKYFVNAEVTSKISFKVVPVPPTPLASELTAVPQLVDRTYFEAVQILDALGIEHVRDAENTDPADSDRVVRTRPEVAELLRPGDRVILHTSREGTS